MRSEGVGSGARGGRLTGVLAGAVHGGHPGALLAGGGLLHAVVDEVDQGKLLVVPQHIGVDVVVDPHALCRMEGQKVKGRHDEGK